MSMSCHDVRARLDDVREGCRDTALERELREHLAGCEACRAELELCDEIAARAAELPRSIEPGRDLWPAIEARIDAAAVVRWPQPARLRRWRALAAAAAVVLAVVAAYQLGRRSAPARIVDAPPAAAPESGDLRWAHGELGRIEYERARAELLEVLEVRRDSLSPETLAVVEDNLQVIRASIEKIQRAVADDPGNPRLAGRLGFAYRQEIDLLRRAVTMPAVSDVGRPARS